MELLLHECGKAAVLCWQRWLDSDLVGIVATLYGFLVLVPEKGPCHRVLVIANQGLEDEALCDEICRRTERTATEAMIVAPVLAHSRPVTAVESADRAR